MNGAIPTLQLKRILNNKQQARLLKQARAGREDAFRRLYRELYEPVARYCRARLNSPEDAEDLVAQVFHKFVRNLDRFDPEQGAVQAWILTLARNTLIDHFRKCKPEQTMAELPQIPAGYESDPLRSLIRDEEACFTHGLLRNYSDDVREMFALRFTHDLSYREIALVMGLSEVAVKKRFSRTMRDLRLKLSERNRRGGESGYATLET
ncbi:MAG: sigma-70 family RNA polymerase sigma factor [bacterium]|nr:sigma-70 family RNA polymerase sigma factor [bacterium]